jgi:hypothetical protein
MGEARSELLNLAGVDAVSDQAMIEEAPSSVQARTLKLAGQKAAQTTFKKQLYVQQWVKSSIRYNATELIYQLYSIGKKNCATPKKLYETLAIISDGNKCHIYH